MGEPLVEGGADASGAAAHRPGRPPFRAETIGSLLRPRPLTQAFRLRNAGALGEAEYRAIQDRAIVNALALQEQVGLEVVTDGEFRRAFYWSPFLDAVEGLATAPAQLQFRDDAGGRLDFTVPHAAAPLIRRRAIVVEEFRFLAAAATRRPKITLPAPSIFHFWHRNAATAEGSVDREALFAHLGAIYRAEIAELAAAGCRYVQLDDVALGMLCDPAIRERLAAEGEDPAALTRLYVGAISEAFAGRPPDMIAALHLCRGNYKGKYLAAGGYEPIAEQVFAEAAVDLFLLEFDTPRAGGFAPLRFVPEGKSAVLGLVSTKTPALESVETICARIKEATRYMVLDRLAVSPQCGFASTVSGNPLSLEHETRKLALVVAAARKVWG